MSALLLRAKLTYIRLKNTNLDRTELSLCVSLIENGVNPDALAVSFLSVVFDLLLNEGAKWLLLFSQTVIKDLRKDTQHLPTEQAMPE